MPKGPQGQKRPGDVIGAAITTAEAFFAEHKERSDPESAIRFLTRCGGEKPRAGDELPN